jgi:hypothetical protein
MSDARLERYVPGQGVAFVGWVQLQSEIPPAVIRWGDRLFVYVGSVEGYHSPEERKYWLYRERGGGLVRIGGVRVERSAPASEPR